MLTYILQVIFFQLLFLLVYEFLLKKETFFTYNRWYLLLTPLIALILPLLKIESLGSLVQAEGFMMLHNVYLNDSSVSHVSAEAATQIFSENNWWWTIYAGGILGSLVVFIKKYQALNKMFRFQVVFNDERVRIIRVPNSNIACTYFNTVFLGDQLSGTEEQQIMSHELVHVKQNHSADLLFFEMLKILLWFNPLIYMYQSRLTVLHEFIADAGALKTSKRQSYYQQLLNTAFNTKNISFINQFFNQSLIKKRIVMLQKSQSQTIAKFKYLIIFPVMLVMLTYVSCSDGISEKNEDIPNEIHNTSALELETKESNSEDVAFGLIDQVPLFPSCENLGSKEEQKKCMSQKIQEHVQKNFNTNMGSELGLTGTNRVIVQFKINKKGDIADVKARAPHPKLEEEAIRVIKSLPQMIPGKEDGKVVGVMYSLPIVFKVAEPGE
ncbi:MAG: energy transducer TonB [Flavobacteriaceae bacterium]|nr:energy transducer TonB [Flavobacteriaceae bacterium]